MPTISPKKFKNCIILCDKSKKGTFRQLEAVADIVVEDFCINTKTIEFESPLLFRLISSKISRFLPICLFRFFKNTNEVLNNISDETLILVSGRRALVFAASLAKHYNVVALFNPRCSFKNFKAILLPEHDGYQQQNNIITFKGALVGLQINKNREQNNRHVITVLLGGDNKYYKYNQDDINSLYDFIKKKIGNLDNVHLKICASRRTNVDLAHHLFCRVKNELTHISFDFWPRFSLDYPLSVSFDHNPYLQYLEQADEIVVTSDSISMLAEACSLGIPVTLWRLPKIPKKFNFFFNGMVSNQYCVYEDVIFPQTHRILNELEKIKKPLLQLLKS